MPIFGAPGTSLNTIRSPLPLAPNVLGRVRSSQQFAEVIHSGGDNRIRLSQQFLEVISAFGSLPPGKSDKAPGHNKPPAVVAQWLLFKERERRARNSATGRFSNPGVLAYSMDYLPQNPEPIRYVDVVKTMRI